MLFLFKLIIAINQFKPNAEDPVSGIFFQVICFFLILFLPVHLIQL